jgi:hypothetical protein
MRFRSMHASRRKSPSVFALARYPIHQPTMNKGSQNEIHSVSPLFWAMSQLDDPIFTCGAVHRTALVDTELDCRALWGARHES